MAMEAGIKPLGARRAIRPPRPTTVLGLCLVGLILVWLIVNGVKDWSGLYANFLIGITNGAVYGLIAIGYSLVYGILGSFKINQNGDTTLGIVTFGKIVNNKAHEQFLKLITPPVALTK